MYLRSFLAACALILPAAAAPVDAPLTRAAEARPGELVDLASDFAHFADGVATRPPEEQVRAFHARYDPVLPGYYRRSGAAQARLDAKIARAIADFPADRAKFMATVAAFAPAYRRGEEHFRRFFPDYRPIVPVYLVHSMGTQDGGTRDIGKRTVLFFGADMIAKIHDADSIGPLVDHELFHVYHQRFFPDCDRVWCSLWQEGLAVYVAARANPGATDRQLLLTMPRPIRPEVEPRLAAAMCRLRARFDSTDQGDYAELFQMQGNGAPFPPRYGYLLGYMLAAKIGEGVTLAEMARMPPATVRARLLTALAAYQPCGNEAPAGARSGG